MQFRENFSADKQPPEARVVLENFHEYNSNWETCIDFIEAQNILCAIEVVCKDIVDQNQMKKQLVKIVESGHYLERDPSCGDFPDMIQRMKFQQAKSILGFNWVLNIFNKSKAVLSLSLPSEAFVDQYQKLGNHSRILLKEDPTYWNEFELLNFQNNIQFLKTVDLNFKNPNDWMD